MDQNQTPDVLRQTGFVRQESLIEKIKHIFSASKYFTGFALVLLVVGLAGGLYLSQQNSDNQQHASANYIPPNGMGIFDSCGPTCLDHLDTFAQAGFKEVIDVSIWNKTLDEVKAYAAKADQDHIKIIWSMKDMWTDKWSDFQFYSKLTGSCGCTDKLGLARYLVNQVKDMPATWGYWIGDEPEDSQHDALLNLANIIRAADPNHPRLVIKNDSLFSGNASSSVNLGNFKDTAEVLGEDYYPVSYGQNLAATGDIANEVQYVANASHRESTMVLEVNSGNLSDYIHASAYPSETQMAEMLTLTLQKSQPRLILWYWYPGLTSGQWNNLLTAIHNVLPTPTMPTTPTPTVPPTPTPIGWPPTPTLVPPPPFSCTTNYDFSSMPEETYPLSTDTRTYSTGNGCFSSTGLGFNTAEGKYTGGPVACPCTTSSTLRPGNTCVYTKVENGQTVCISGYGAFGLNGGCKYDPGHSTQVTCPATMAFAIQVKDSAGSPLSGISMRISDNGVGSTQTTDSSGKITIQSWSGDRVVMTPPDYRFTPNYIVATVNDVYSCGTVSLNKTPCIFTLTQANDSPTPSLSPSPFASDSGTQVVGDINGDGFVDIQDYNILMSCYNVKVSNPTANCPNPKGADLDGNGIVDGVDYNILLRVVSPQQ